MESSTEHLKAEPAPKKRRDNWRRILRIFGGTEPTGFSVSFCHLYYFASATSMDLVYELNMAGTCKVSISA